ncbi:helix-turn-helix transcriptional regulator [Azospirillum sp. Marseille-Q6669]
MVMHNLPVDLSSPALSLVEAATEVGGAVVMYAPDDSIAWANDAQRRLVPELRYGAEETYETIFWCMLETGRIGNKMAASNPQQWLAFAVATRHSMANLEFVNTYPWGQMLVSQLRLDNGVSIQARVDLAIAGVDRYFNAPAVGVGVVMAAKAQRELKTFQATLDGLELGLALVNRSGSIIHANGSMRDLIKKCDGLEEAANRSLCACDQCDDMMLQRAISLAAERPMRTPVLVPIRRLNGRSPHLLAVSSGASPGTAVVVVSRFGESIDDIASALQQAFNLTAAEAQVTARLGAGMSIAEISHERGVSEGTVYNQVKAIKASLRRSNFAAKGLHDISALVMKVAAIARAFRA